MFLYQIFSQVYEKFRGLPVRLAERHNKSDDWYRSWGYKPRSMDASAYGSDCPELREHFRLAENFEACYTGAGVLYNLLTYVELKRRLEKIDTEDFSLREIRHLVLDEATDVLRCLDECDLHEAKRPDIERWKAEVIQMIQAGEKALIHLDKELDERANGAAETAKV